MGDKDKWRERIKEIRARGTDDDDDDDIYRYSDKTVKTVPSL